MKKLILFLLALNFISCEKFEMDDVVGLYNVNVKDIRCSYYFCDTINYQTTFHIQYFENRKKGISIEFYDSIDLIRNTNQINFESVNNNEIIFSGYYTSKLTINKESKLLNYYEFYNNKKQLEDTISHYLIIEGYKQ